MKKYLLLASVAGCLLAHNAMAAGSPSATLNMSAKFITGFWTDVHNINFGTMVLTDGATDDDLLATFTNGTLSVESDKVSYHSGEEAGYASLSSGSAVVTGFAFSSETVALKNSENETIAEVYDLAMGSLMDPSEAPYDSLRYNWINAKLRLKNREDMGSNYDEATGTTTLTFQF